MSKVPTCGALLMWAQMLQASNDVINYGGEMKSGSAIVTSRSGDLQVSDFDGRRMDTPAHEVLVPSNLSFQTQGDGLLFFTLSNGVAVGLDHNSDLDCIEFKQRPFDAADQALGLEPSISKLRVQLNSGQISIASNRLSPLSDIRVALPKGEIRFHKGTCLIRVDSTGLHITAHEGNLTYYYPDKESREFIAAPMGVRISEQSMQLQTVTETSTVADLEPSEDRLCRATRHASRRVTFEPNQDTDAPPAPLLIVRPSYFEQEAARPYQFID